MRVRAFVDYSSVSANAQLRDPVAWSALWQLITEAEHDGSTIGDDIAVLTDDDAAELVAWADLADNPLLAEKALRTAVASAIVCAQAMKHQSYLARAILHLIRHHGLHNAEDVAS